MHKRYAFWKMQEEGDSERKKLVWKREMNRAISVSMNYFRIWSIFILPTLICFPETSVKFFFLNFMQLCIVIEHWINPFGIYLFKVNNRNTRTRCEICSKLTIKTSERHHWRRSGVFIVNFEHILHLVVVFLLLTLNRQMPTGNLRKYVKYVKRDGNQIGGEGGHWQWEIWVILIYMYIYYDIYISLWLFLSTSILII